jgi:hypothetical protein
MILFGYLAVLCIVKFVNTDTDLWYLFELFRRCRTRKQILMCDNEVEVRIVLVAKRGILHLFIYIIIVQNCTK